MQGIDPSVVPKFGLAAALSGEPLSGAKAFIGSWQLSSSGSGPSGELCFLRNGDVELRSSDSGHLLGASAQPWTYISPKLPDTIIRLSFTLDCGALGGVLSYDGTFDVSDGSARVIRGGFEGGEVWGSNGKLIGLKQMGTFTAALRATAVK